jgi:UPF0716 protein FxsA
LFKLLILLFIFVPLTEIYLLLQIGTQIGAVPTLGLIVLTALIGAFLLRIQGLITLAKIRQSLDQGELPADSLIEGLILLIAGVLLLTPGFITDILGFVCLIPRIRQGLVKLLIRRFFVQHVRPPESQPVVLEGEFHTNDQ